MIAYSGGLGAVPYELLKDDSEKQNYTLTQLARYPEGVTVFRSFLGADVDENYLRAWEDHLKAQRTDSVSFDKKWQFFQPSPGRFEYITRDTPYAPASYRLPADSLDFVKKNSVRQEIEETMRDDGLPSVTDAPLYLSIPEDRHEHLIKQLGEKSVFSELLRELRAHDLAAPREVRFFSTLR